MRQALITIAIWLVSVAAIAAPAPQGFVVHDTPQGIANIRFVDKDGTRMDIADFRGRVVLLNVWATWCVPCRVEMPTLDALQAELGGPDFEVLALSIDSTGPGIVQRFFDDTGIRNLNMYVDTTMLSATALRAVGLPTTLLIGRDGKEIGRLVGPAEWDAPEMVDFLRSSTK